MTSATINGVDNGSSGDTTAKASAAPVVAEKKLEPNGITSETVDSSDAKDTEKTPERPVGSECSLKHLYQQETPGGAPKITERNMTGADDPYKVHAIVVKACYNLEHKLEKTTLKINSPHILRALKHVVKYYPSEPLNFDDSGSYEINHPYMMLHHHYEELQAYAAGDEIRDSDDATAHLKVLLDFLEADGKDARKLRDANLITFEHLWLIYKPGQLLYHSQHGHQRLFRISHIGYSESPQNGKVLGIRCTFTSCDGLDSGTASEKLDIYERQEFSHNTATPIQSLSVFPFTSLGDEEDLEEIKTSLIERGERYLQITGVKVYQYEGLHLYLKSPPDDFYNECASYSGTWLPATTHGRIVVDAKTFAEEANQQSESIFSWRRKQVDPSGENDDYTLRSKHSDPLLAPPHVFGFCLESKNWCKFFVDALRPAKWAPNALDSLVLPTHRKSVIRALVAAHQDHSEDPAPTVTASAQRDNKTLICHPCTGRVTSTARNEALAKGKGLIILLHGTPGSGKTLTAELMAEHTRRPLLNISVGELGSWEHRISRELKRLLTYASIWRAIVLIDEADVFLESRKSGPSDMLAQNALVAVFLRQLEYFRGIAFLTSNRVEVIDEAVKSRIHLALRYEGPDAGVRRRLWANKLRGLGLGKEGKPSAPREVNGWSNGDGQEHTTTTLNIESLLDEVCDAGMNGREISNAVNTARTLAADEGVALNTGHIVTVVTLWREFKGSFEMKNGVV